MAKSDDVVDGPPTPQPESPMTPARATDAGAPNPPATTARAHAIPEGAVIKPPDIDQPVSGSLALNDKDVVVFKYVGKGRVLSFPPPRDLLRSEVLAAWPTKDERAEVLSLDPPIWKANWDKDDLPNVKPEVPEAK